MLLLSAPAPLLMLPARATARIFSFGGGVQSHAVLALQTLGRLPNPYDVFLFANVGADSENPETLDYIEKYTKPFCEKHGIKFVEVQKQRGRGKDKTPDTLLQRIYRGKKSIPIPARMGGNGAPGQRACTEDHKIKVIHGYIRKESKAAWVISGIGISIDEFHRVRDIHWHDGQGKQKYGFMNRREYPLVDLRINRDACKRLIAEVGLPEPPKSSCYFCPFKKRGEWLELKRERPDLFQKAVELEQHINHVRNDALGKDAMYLHPSLTPLDQAVGNQPLLFDFDALESCDEGVCMV